MRYLNGWHPFESIRFDLVKNYYVAMPSSSDLGATQTASTKTKSNSMRRLCDLLSPTPGCSL